jgi:hypothetical protein
VVTVSRVLLFTTVGLLSGCGTIPAAPSVMALPGQGKTLEQFHAEDTSCRQWAAQQTQETVKGASTGQLYGSAVGQWYDMAYMQCQGESNPRGQDRLFPATSPTSLHTCPAWLPTPCGCRADASGAGAIGPWVSSVLHRGFGWPESARVASQAMHCERVGCPREDQSRADGGMLSNARARGTMWPTPEGIHASWLKRMT